MWPRCRGWTLASKRDRVRSPIELTAGDEGHHDVGGMAVQVLTAPVIYGGRPGIRMSGRDLHLTQGTPASRAAMMNPARSRVRMVGRDQARLPMHRTRRSAVRRVQAMTVVADQDRDRRGVRRRPRSMVRAVRGTSGMRAGLWPLPTICSTR